jgi:ABC-type nickel/cobalt efflux system permease component RcnA
MALPNQATIQNSKEHTHTHTHTHKKKKKKKKDKIQWVETFVSVLSHGPRKHLK